MATIKSYSDLQQSKKLAKLLPITSIDFAWNIFSDGSTRLLRMDDWEVSENAKSNVDIIPCFSLAALLSIIPQVKLDSIKQYDKKYWRCCAYFASDWRNSDWCDNPVDACYEMIIKLHELKKL
jgi:hypothetical protein